MSRFLFFVTRFGDKGQTETWSLCPFVFFVSDWWRY